MTIRSYILITAHGFMQITAASLLFVSGPLHAMAQSEWDQSASIVVGNVVKSGEPSDLPGWFSAKLLVIEVLQGEADLVGKAFTAFTSDLDRRGLREICIRPMLKPGDVGVFQIEGGGTTYRQILWGGGAYGDALPVIKDSPFDVDGSKRSYQDVLQRFRDRRDHPGKYAMTSSPLAEVTNAKPSQPPSVPEIAVSQPTTVPQPGVRADDEKHTGEERIFWWWMSGILLVMFVAWVCVLSRRRSPKGDGA